MPRLVDPSVIAFGLLLTAIVALPCGLHLALVALATQVVGWIFYRLCGRHPVPAKAAVLITGCSSGIGKAAALHLSSRGLTVFATVRKQEDAATLRAIGGQIVPVLVDVCDEAQCAAAARTVGEELQRRQLSLLGIVNNAGYSQPVVLEAITLQDVRRQFETNVFGALAVTQAFLPLLRQSALPARRVVFVSSAVGSLAIPTLGAYAASKHALEGMADALRRELQSWDIDVCVAQLGSIKTEWGPTQRAAIKDKVATAADESPVSRRYAAMGARLMRTSSSFELLSSTGVTSALIESALLDVVPKTRYRAGWDVFFGIPFLKALPDRLVDLMLAGQFRSG